MIHKNSRRGTVLTAAAAVLLLAAGGTAIGVGLASNGSPPQPPVAAAAAAPATPVVPAPTVSPGATPEPPARPEPAAPVGPILTRSTPTQLTIPAIGVDSALMGLGRNADGTVEVPPLGAASPAGWYRGSPTPGELGPAALLGHVDSSDGPSVFYRLGEMRPGDEVSVTREDGTVAVFTVDRVEQYAKAEFPSLAVYGNTDNSQLRLITCGGVFDRSIGHYVDNIVVYASLVSSHPA